MDNAQAVKWKDELKEFVKVNDKRRVEGIHSLMDLRIPFNDSSKPGAPYNDTLLFSL